MSDATFPTFLGLKIVGMRRTSILSTTLQVSKSGKECTWEWYGTPRYRYEFDLAVLRTSHPTAGNEVATFLNFFETMRGRYDTFNFTDPYTGASVRARFDMDEAPVERISLDGKYAITGIIIVSVK